MRSRQFSGESERSHSEVAPALEGRNAAAWGHSTLQTEGPMSSTSDEKRNNAAQLAQELGSSSPWSEAFMPASCTPTTFPTQYAATSSEQRVQVDNPHTAMAQPQQDVDPPPAYSNLPQVHELAATSVSIVPRTGSTARTEREIANSACTDPEQNEDLEEQEQDVRAPLLGHIRRRWNQRGRGHWVHGGKTGRQRHCRLLAMVIAFSVIVSIIVCALVDGFEEVGRPLFLPVWDLMVFTQVGVLPSETHKPRSLLALSLVLFFLSRTSWYLRLPSSDLKHSFASSLIVGSSGS